MKQLRFIIAVIGALAVALTLGLSANASANVQAHKRSCASQLDDILATAHGNQLRVGGNDAAGNSVIEKANNIGNGQPVCFVQTSTTNGHMVGYFKADDNGNRFGVGPNCATGVSWQNTTDGTLWIWIDKSGGFDLQNKACGNVLSSDNSAGDQWTRRASGANGYYQLLNLHAPGTNPVHTTAFVSFSGHSPRTTTTIPHRQFPVPSSRRASTLDWCDAHFGGCMRDPSSGGLNTVIQASLQSNSDAEDWSLQSNNGPCQGTVTATCPGGWLSANARGFAFVTLRNIGQGSLCFGANAQNFWTAKMATCDGVNNTHHWDTVYVYDPQASCGSTTLPGFLSYQWQRNGNSNGAWIVDNQGLNNPLIVQFAPNIAHCNEALWGPTAS